MVLAITIPIVVVSLAVIGILVWRRDVLACCCRSRRYKDMTDYDEVESWRRMNLANQEKFSPARNY